MKKQLLYLVIVLLSLSSCSSKKKVVDEHKTEEVKQEETVVKSVETVVVDNKSNTITRTVTIESISPDKETTYEDNTGKKHKITNAKITVSSTEQATVGTSHTNATVESGSTKSEAKLTETLHKSKDKQMFCWWWLLLLLIPFIIYYTYKLYRRYSVRF